MCQRVIHGLHPLAVVMAAGICCMLIGPISAREPELAFSRKGMVTSVAPTGSEVGVVVLEQGGNAVDAAVAVALALTVTWPDAGNIGGGGFMMIWPGGGKQPVCIDYRETAPAAASETMFSLKDSSLGHRMVAVPGTVRGLALAHGRYGKLPWKNLVLPAQRLAEEGVTVDTPLAISLNEVLEEKGTAGFPELRRVFAPPDGKAWRAGDKLVQKDLARTLRRLADQGPDAFYTGSVAEEIIAEMQAGGGLITRDDLASYEAKVREPIHGTFRGYDIYGPPPPSSGGIALVEMLNILEHLDLKKHGRWSPQTSHLMVEAMRRAYLDRARHLGDPEFSKIPEHLTSKEHAAKLAREIDTARATKSESLSPDIAIADESESTTHFCVADGSGMAVSNTYTLEHSFGSRVMVRGAGFLLNNEMGDFNRKSGHTDRRGRIGTPPNLIRPGKRMLSSQTPALVAHDGKLVLLTGSPGGRTIINTVLQVLVNSLEFHMPPRACIESPRLHHQWLPDVVQYEEGTAEFKAALAGLRPLGHVLDAKPRSQGDAHSIWIDQTTGEFIGVADGRRSGSARGW
jgi:gamma-glutamyltranspeptidase/glutathione hydrolase